MMGEVFSSDKIPQLKINPYDQPSVELIKKETKKILI